MFHITSSHFDFGLLLLMNYMFGGASFGVWLNSGGATHAMKLLEQEEYAPFVEQFLQVPSAVTEGKLLHEEMKIQGRRMRIAVAWRHYSGARLREKGFGLKFGDLWQQKYVEIPEFFAYGGSFSEYHLGARFPLVFPEGPAEDDTESITDQLAEIRVSGDLAHLRGHIYVGRRFMKDPQGRRNFVRQIPEGSPVDIFGCPTRQGMEALSQFLAEEFAVQVASRDSRGSRGLAVEDGGLPKKGGSPAAWLGAWERGGAATVDSG